MLYAGHWFEVLPEDYVIEFNTSAKSCALCLSPSSSRDYFILGDTFLRGWYAIHDFDNQRMGFIPQASSSKKEAVLSTTTPDGVFTVPSVNL